MGGGKGGVGVGVRSQVVVCARVVWRIYPVTCCLFVCFFLLLAGFVALPWVERAMMMDRMRDGTKCKIRRGERDGMSNGDRGRCILLLYDQGDRKSVV